MYDPFHFENVLPVGHLLTTIFLVASATAFSSVPLEFSHGVKVAATRLEGVLLMLQTLVRMLYTALLKHFSGFLLHIFLGCAAHLFFKTLIEIGYRAKPDLISDLGYRYAVDGQ